MCSLPSARSAPGSCSRLGGRERRFLPGSSRPGETERPARQAGDQQRQQRRCDQCLTRMKAQSSDQRKEANRAGDRGHDRPAEAPVGKIRPSADLGEGASEPVLVTKELAQAGAIEVANTGRRSEGEPCCCCEWDGEDGVFAGKQVLGEPAELLQRAAADQQVAACGVCKLTMSVG